MKLLKELTPPLILKWYKKIRSSKYGWFGNYGTWEEAEKNSSGYNAGIILEKVKNALLKVKNGEAVYERDSVLFDTIEYSYPLLANLMWIATQNEGKLNIIDFGGSLGSTYFQNRFFLKDLKEVNWNIVEQENFVECGKNNFEDDILKFYPNVETCLQEQSSNVMLLGCTLPYIEHPYELLDFIFQSNFEYIIIDRTPFISQANDRLTVQVIPPSIYEASYPAWFFSEKKFMDFISKKYDQVFEYIGDDYSNIDCIFKGKVLKLKQND